jgi:carbamoylphosphate synthase large subunit
MRPDFEDVTTQLALDIKKHQQVRIYTDEEILLEYVAELNETFQLAGLLPSEAEVYRDKFLMKQTCGTLTHSVSPWVAHVGMASQAMKDKFPFIIKPKRSAGALGVQYIPEQTALEAYIKKNKPCLDNLMIEEWIDGELYHCDLLMAKGEVKFFAAGQYLDTLMHAVQNRPYMGSELLTEASPYYQQLYQAAVEVNQQFKVDNAITHTEFMLKDGQLYFIEIGLRPAGGWVSTLYNKALGFNIFNNHFYAFAGCSIDNICESLPKYALGFSPLLTKSGVLKAINIPPFSSNILIKVKKDLVNTYRERTKSAVDALGEVIMMSDNHDEFSLDKACLEKSEMVVI